METIQEAIQKGRTALGIELGSTRIKAVLIGPDHGPIASGDHTWENKLENGYWTYPLDEVWTGIQAAFAALAANVRAAPYHGGGHGHLWHDARLSSF